jgi:hypothetical protein
MGYKEEKNRAEVTTHHLNVLRIAVHDIESGSIQTLPCDIHSLRPGRRARPFKAYAAVRSSNKLIIIELLIYYPLEGLSPLDIILAIGTCRGRGR